MNLESHLALSIPTSFGKCLNNIPADNQEIAIKTSHVGPKCEEKALELIQHANQHFQMKGTLSLDDRGFLYVDLPDHYVYELFEMLSSSKAELPPYFVGEFMAGAHISVATAKEEFNKAAIAQLGQEITFTITGAFHVSPKNWIGVDRVHVLTIDAPELVEIRRSLGLSDKIMDNEFHITYAIEKEFLKLDDLLSASKKGIEIDSKKSAKRKITQMKRMVNGKA